VANYPQIDAAFGSLISADLRTGRSENHRSILFDV